MRPDATIGTLDGGCGVERDDVSRRNGSFDRVVRQHLGESLRVCGGKKRDSAPNADGWRREAHHERGSRAWL